MITLLLTLTASADVSPGPFYREDCTVDRKEQDGTTCDTCSGSYQDGSDSGLSPCEEQFSDTDYTYACSTNGASAWTEVWCDGPPAEGCGGCATGTPGTMGLLAGFLVIAGMRRRQGA
ncbi:MAG: hypothetical protein ACI8RZ_000108 [Myxococcota bacterium]|jgi:hypothetical protein